MLQFLKQILQLIINPERGWEDVSHDGADPAILRRKAFFPLLGVATLSCAGEFLKIGAKPTIIGVISDAIITATVYFATLFFADFMFSATMGRLTDKEPSQRKDATFITYNLAILVIIEIIINVVPVDLSMLNFLVIYVGVIIYKGMRYLSVRSDREGHFMFMAIFSTIVPPYLLMFLFKNVLMPQ